MKLKTVAIILTTLAGCAQSAAAATGPTPAPKQTVTFTQGATARTLPALSPSSCVQIVGAVIRARSGTCDSGSYVQFQKTGGDVSVHFSVQDACPPLPAPVTRHADCPVGTKGNGWTQTATYTAAPAPTCAVLGPYLPTDYPAGACVPVTPPPQQLQPPVNQSALTPVAKPARGVPFTTQFGTTETRVTDHAVDRPAAQFARNDYSRRNPFNADKSRVVVYEGGGPWLVYRVPANTLEKVLNGPGGDAEVQWSPTDPDKLYFMPTNGGTKLFELTVSTNTYTTYYDMTAQAQAALGPQCDRLWTRSEGSPSADNRRWGFICQHYNQATGDFDTKGYIAFDVIAHTVLWSQVSTVGADHTSMTPSGRSIVVSGPHEMAYEVGSSRTCDIRTGGEHSDIGVMPNGHDFMVTVDFQTNDGDVFTTDIDQCYTDGHPTRVVVTHVYNNPWLGAHYSEHFSAKAFNRPGFFTMSGYGYAPAPLLAYDMTAAAWYGVGTTMTTCGDYFCEIQAALSRDGKSILFNDSFGPALNVDAYRVDLP